MLKKKLISFRCLIELQKIELRSFSHFPKQIREPFCKSTNSFSEVRNSKVFEKTTASSEHRDLWKLLCFVAFDQMNEIFFVFLRFFLTIAIVWKDFIKI